LNDLVALGTKLRKYREHFQASLAEVSASTGITENDLNAFESGLRLPTGDEVLILADYFRCDFKFFLSSEQLAPFEQTEILYRRYGNEFSKLDRWAVQEFLFLCECEEFLMTVVQVLPRLAFHFQKRGTFYKRHGAEAADALRRALGYSNISVEMNVYRDLRRIGFHVFRRKLENSNISGLYVMHPTAGKCVLVNYSEDVYRQRFTAAHEAAHAILDETEEVVVSFTDDSSSEKGRDLREVRANRFASHYLIPPAFLKSIPHARMWDPDRVLEWAAKLKVSTEALTYALVDADLVSGDAVDRLKTVKVPNDAKQDPELPSELSPASRLRRQELLSRGLSVYYVDLCFQAYYDRVISAGRLAEMLLVDETGLAELAQVYGKRLSYGA